MRNTRAVIAGLGTTGSMLAAAACVFLVASAVIAFKGWPGVGISDRIDSLFVNDASPVAAWDQPGTSAVATSAGTAAAAVAATPAGPTFGTPGVALGPNGTSVSGGITLPNGSVITPPGSPGAGGAASPVAGGGPGAPGVPGTGQVQSGVNQTVQRTGSTVGGAVRNTTGQVGGTVGGPVGDAVTQTGQGVGDTVESTTGALTGGH